jgi:hypothetical protein
MNKKVENLIKQEKTRLGISERQRRKNHLMSIGLIDESKTERKYQDYGIASSKYDEEKRMYYVEVAGALDVTDEEYEEICKYFPPTKEEVILQTRAENTLDIIANVTLICGIICTLICLFTIGFVDNGYSSDKEFSPMGLATTIGILISSLITWATLKVFCGISINLRKINSKIK